MQRLRNAFAVSAQMPMCPAAAEQLTTRDLIPDLTFPRCLRVLHVPSMTVFSNWPTSKSPLHYVHSTAYSPNSGYLAIGNARGRVLLYRLHHYSKA